MSKPTKLSLPILHPSFESGLKPVFQIERLELTKEGLFAVQSGISTACGLTTQNGSTVLPLERVQLGLDLLPKASVPLKKEVVFFYKKWSLKGTDITYANGLVVLNQFKILMPESQNLKRSVISAGSINLTLNNTTVVSSETVSPLVFSDLSGTYTLSSFKLEKGGLFCETEFRFPSAFGEKTLLYRNSVFTPEHSLSLGVLKEGKEGGFIPLTIGKVSCSATDFSFGTDAKGFPLFVFTNYVLPLKGDLNRSTLRATRAVFNHNGELYYKELDYYADPVVYKSPSGLSIRVDDFFLRPAGLQLTGSIDLPKTLVVEQTIFDSFIVDIDDSGNFKSVNSNLGYLHLNIAGLKTTAVSCKIDGTRVQLDQCEAVLDEKTNTKLPVGTLVLSLDGMILASEPPREGSFKQRMFGLPVSFSKVRAGNTLSDPLEAEAVFYFPSPFSPEKVVFPTLKISRKGTAVVYEGKSIHSLSYGDKEMSVTFSGIYIDAGLKFTTGELSVRDRGDQVKNTINGGKIELPLIHFNQPINFSYGGQTRSISQLLFPVDVDDDDDDEPLEFEEFDVDDDLFMYLK